MSTSIQLHQTPASSDVDIDFEYAADLLNSVMFPLVLQESLNMNLFEIIAKYDQGSGVTAKQIAEELNTSNPEATALLDRMLYMLTCHQVLNCTISYTIKFYSLAPVGKFFVKNEMGLSLGQSFSAHRLFIEACFELKNVVMEGGKPFDRAHGMPVFEYMDRNEDTNRVFNEVMHDHTSLFMSKFLEGYKGLEHINRLVDVAGGLGVSLGMITVRHPHIKGINFDLPHVIAHAPSYSGVEHIGGDMFESVPSGDAIFMKWILHDWSDERCVKLLKNCYKALPENGKVIVVEVNLPEIPDNSQAAKSASNYDMIMLLVGGKERTANEFLKLANEAGFSGIKHAGFFSNFWVMEFYK